MPIKLTQEAYDRGSYAVNLSFTDSSGDSMTPTSIKWWLTDHKGAIINLNSSVTVTPATAVTILLQGDDLDYTDGYRRILTVNCEYNTLVNGSAVTGIPVRESAEFAIKRIIGGTTS